MTPIQQIIPSPPNDVLFPPPAAENDTQEPQNQAFPAHLGIETNQGTHEYTQPPQIQSRVAVNIPTANSSTSALRRPTDDQNTTLHRRNCQFQ
jgi:hypothetical protein